MKNKKYIISILFVLTFMFITTGYALLNKDIGLNGNVYLTSSGGSVKITRVELDNAANKTLEKFGTLELDENGNLNLNYNLSESKTEKTYQATYLIYVSNLSTLDYIFTGINIEPIYNIISGSEEDSTINISYEVNSDNKNHELNIGDTLSANDTKIVAITLKMYIATKSTINVNVNGSGNATTTMDDTGELLSSIDKDILYLQSNREIDNCFNINILNSYKYSKNVTITSSNSNFYITKDNNINPTLTIPKESENNIYNLCLNIKDNAVFVNDRVNTSIIMTSDLNDILVKSINVFVDIYEEPIIDDTPPEIDNVNIIVDRYDINTNSLIINTSWNLINVSDTDTAVNNYHILLYDASNDRLINDYETGNGKTNYTITMDSNMLNEYENDMVVNNHDYYIKVYGIDDMGNSGYNYCSSNTNYCVKGSNISLKWKYKVEYSLINITYGGEDYAYRNNTYTSTLKANDGYYLPNNITITMGSTLTRNEDYTYNRSSTTNQINITKPIIDDIKINASGTTGGGCLVKGTKIKIIDGYKNIEDVTYDDLLSVWSYEKGMEVYTYPIAIEEEKTTDEYIRITFSDCSNLDVYYDHGIYSLDSNRYVSILDRDNFHIGTKVFKINNVVTVTNIENIKENTTYYNITSTRYLNVIANDFLTVDYLLPISNIYSFDENIKWTSERDEYLKENNFLDYNLIKDYFPYYLYKGIRLDESMYLLENNKIDINSYINEYNTHKFIPIGNKFPIRTSDEDKNTYYLENAYYTLPNPKNNTSFKCWYNTSDNICYNIGDKVLVNYGMYFDAFYE